MSGQCKEDMVPTAGTMMGYHHCERRATKDGYCWQHHPDRVKARQAAADERWRAKQEQSPLAKLRAAQDRIRELSAELEGLERRLAHVHGILAQKDADGEDLGVGSTLFISCLRHSAPGAGD